MQISENTIEKVLDLLYDSNENSATTIMEQMSKEQPVILSYIMQMGEELTQAEETETLIFLAVLSWKAFHTEFGNIPSVSEEEVKIAEDELFNKMESLNSESNMLAQIEQELQPILMSCLAQEVLANKPENLDENQYRDVAVHMTSLQVITNAMHKALFR